MLSKNGASEGRLVLALAWLSYTLAYLLRVNVAVVIPDLVREEGFRYSQVGQLTSLFFITYLLGQLVNGYLGDRNDGKTMIAGGLMLSALCNLVMSTGYSYPLMLIVWGINGMAQSMLWAPLMKTLSDHFAARHLNKLSFIMAQSVVFGYVLSWGSASILRQSLGWQAAFRWPAVIVVIFAFIWLFLFPKSRSIEGESSTTPRHVHTRECDARRTPMKTYFIQMQMTSLLFIALFQGLIREGIAIWLPAILQDFGGRLSELSWLILMIVPLLHFIGVLIVRKLHQQCNFDSQATLAILYAPIAFLAAALMLSQNINWLALLIMALMLALAHGMTPLLTSVIPFEHKEHRRVAFSTGLLDFSIYCGAALSSLVGGVIADQYGLSGQKVLWIVAAVIGLSFSIFRFKRNA